jgi:hypothetical protein
MNIMHSTHSRRLAAASSRRSTFFLCDNFNLPGESAIKKVCEGLAVVAAIPLQLALEAGETPDVTCQTGGLKFLNMCSPADVANQCRLFSAPVRERAAHTFRASSAAAAASSPSSPLHERQTLVQTVSWHLRMFAGLLGGGGAGLGPAPAAVIKSAKTTAAAVAGGQVAAGKPKHTPALDLDLDYFSVLPTLRGSDWRGKDCNDIDANIYPGRALNLQGPNIDHNCNGISGVDASQRSYEDAFCGGPNAPRGTIVIGDSASAHFGIPPQYLMPDNQNGSMVYANLVSFAVRGH